MIGGFPVMSHFSSSRSSLFTSQSSSSTGPPEEVRVASYRRLSGQEKRTKVACLNGPSVLSPSRPPPPLPAVALFLRCLELSHAIDFARFLQLVPDCWCLRQPCPNSTSVWNLLRVNDKNPEKIRIENLYLFDMFFWFMILGLLKYSIFFSISKISTWLAIAI